VVLVWTGGGEAAVCGPLSADLAHPLQRSWDEEWDEGRPVLEPPRCAHLKVAGHRLFFHAGIPGAALLTPVPGAMGKMFQGAVNKILCFQNSEVVLDTAGKVWLPSYWDVALHCRMDGASFCI
jgi:hypothetical protein